jgi:hypothetical protein
MLGAKLVMANQFSGGNVEWLLISYKGQFVARISSLIHQSNDLSHVEHPSRTAR